MKLGIAGSGNIVKEALDALTFVPEIELEAIVVREKSLNVAQELQAAYNIQKIFTDYQAFLDVITSYSIHYTKLYDRQYQQDILGDPPARLLVRQLYNPNLEFKWHVLPSLVAIITTIGCLIVTALSVAREREEGTFDRNNFV